MLFYVARNAVRLMLERRRRVLGSKLRTRLVLAFISLSLIPTALIYLVSVKFVQTSVDYWFKGQVEESMEQALELGRAFYGSAQERLERRGDNMIAEIKRNEFAWGGKGHGQLPERKVRGIRSEASWASSIRRARSRTPTPRPQWTQAWPEIKETIDWQSLKADPRSWTTILPKPGSDLVLGVTPVDEGRSGYLVIGETVGHGLMHRLDQIVRGLDEYKKLKTRKISVEDEPVPDHGRHGHAHHPRGHLVRIPAGQGIVRPGPGPGRRHRAHRARRPVRTSGGTARTTSWASWSSPSTAWPRTWSRARCPCSRPMCAWPSRTRSLSGAASILRPCSTTSPRASSP